MHIRHLATILLITVSAAAYGGSGSFNRFTDDLPQLLETDAATVMVRGLTHDFAGKLCARLGGPVSQEVQTEVAEWRKRNDPFIKAAASALNEFGDRYLPVGGEPAKQGYFQMILQTTAKEANKRVMRQLNGANLDNNIVPPERACLGLANLLRDRVGDFEHTPEVTRALVTYIQRKGQATAQPQK